MLLLSDSGLTHEAARERVAQAWRSGEAHQEFHAMIARQGGNWSASMESYASCAFVDITATTSGYVPDVHAREVAIAAMQAGAGRLVESDVIDHAAGTVFFVDPGDPIEAGQPLARVYARDAKRLGLFAHTMQTMLKTATAPVEREPSVLIDVWKS
jgi:thymidine phosphorylase